MVEGAALEKQYRGNSIASSNLASSAILCHSGFLPELWRIIVVRLNSAEVNAVNVEFGGARTRAGACSEHATAEEAESRYPAASAIRYYFLVTSVFGFVKCRAANVPAPRAT